jgi:hypothetical protein
LPLPVEMPCRRHITAFAKQKGGNWDSVPLKREYGAQSRQQIFLVRRGGDRHARACAQAGKGLRDTFGQGKKQCFIKDSCNASIGYAKIRKRHVPTSAEWNSTASGLRPVSAGFSL